MSEPRIGRVLVASLHQAIADVLPSRLEFYENWLNAHGLREGSEGEAYNLITGRAGEYAADWTVSGMPTLERRIIRAMPVPIRARLAMRTASALVRATYPGSRAIVKVRRGVGSVDLRGSLFCEVREASVLPLCGFYASAIAHVLQQFALRADARVSACRAAGGRKGCQLQVAIQAAGANRPATAA
jgi:hypothetical protein